jgi:4-aminobutyrate aminotransferase/(S)-3-amino-2-methylpropionate transaminase
MDAPEAGGLGGTYGGNPLACAAALAVLDVIEQERLVARAGRIGETIVRRFRGWQDRFPFIGDVRGLGAMCGMELVDDRTAKTPARALTTAVLAAGLQRGLLMLKSGVYDNVIRMLLPLVITDGELDRGLDLLEDALAHARS